MMATTASSRLALALASILALSASACTSDQLVAPPAATRQPAAPEHDFFSARNAFARYVAIGTSISAGVQSDGLIAATQTASWPAQLDAMVGRSLKQPYIGGTGCHAPVVAPLLLGIRLSGESALTPPPLLGCGPLLPGLAIPFDNVALNGATLSDAATKSPPLPPTDGDAGIYGHVLVSGQTQLSTMIARNPTLVSVELGSNEVLGGITGIAPSFDPSAWGTGYLGFTGQVKLQTNTAVLVGLIDDVRHVAAFRTGAELYKDSFEFALFHVSVSSDCGGVNKDNLIFLPLGVAPVALAGLNAAQHGLPPVPFSCADQPGIQDYILTPSDVLTLNGELAGMDLAIAFAAHKWGFAEFRLSVLYDRPDVKGPFSLTKLMTSGAPFGPYFSLDGLHPNAAGQAILARAAANALNGTYGLGIPIL